ncbi:hypothetical protein HQT34_001656 [Campylobacter coli]|nr:hypothetical protein [Campylobacter coli]EFV4750365.1 hypothetical protein [Campylobacter coli]
MKEIVEINDSSIVSTVYGIEKTNIDYATGEIKEKDNILIKKVKKKDEFIKMMALNLQFIATELENSEKTILFLLMSNMNYKNIVNINSDLKSELIHKSKLHRNTVSKAINSLQEKKVILKLDTDELRQTYDVFSKNSFLINPNIIGKGSFRDLRNLRQTIIQNFNADRFEMTKEIVTEVEYNGLQEIKNNKEDYEIKAIQQTQNNNEKNTEIFLAKKGNVLENKQPTLFDENQKEQEARLFIEKYAGILTGAFDPTKSAKELKREKLDKDLEEGRI